MAEYFKLYNENPNERFIKKIVEILRSGGVIIYPTDTVYGLGCDIYNQKAIERIARIKGLKLENANFSFICYDLSNLSEFTKAVNNQVFKVMKHNLPGAFTFILNANSTVPKLFKNFNKIYRRNSWISYRPGNHKRRLRQISRRCYRRRFREQCSVNYCWLLQRHNWNCQTRIGRIGSMIPPFF